MPLFWELLVSRDCQQVLVVAPVTGWLAQALGQQALPTAETSSSPEVTSSFPLRCFSLNL